MRPIEHVTAGHDIDFSADLDLHQTIMTRPVERFKSLQFRKRSVELVSTSLDPLIEYLVGRVSALIIDRNRLVAGGSRRCQNSQMLAALMATTAQAFCRLTRRTRCRNQRAIEGGAEGLLTKPIDFTLLREEIDTRLDQPA